jgi:cytidyltransferase-like protein
MGFQDSPEVICIHGRFQPFHLGHMDYLHKCLERWPKVIVGLVTPPSQSSAISQYAHRNQRSSNPLSYLERMHLVRLSLEELGCDQGRVDFVPFPIDSVDQLDLFIPKNMKCVTTDLYEWNRFKISQLETAGFEPLVLSECEKVSFDGTLIRQLMIKGDRSWTEMVAAKVASALLDWQIEERLRLMQGSEDAAPESR